MRQPLISVLIPTYNVEAYIEIAINSILFQTYQNLEIIIVDDGSSDNTYTILERLAKSDRRIRLFKNEVNRRIADTLNHAFKLSKGDYIARMDGDDISLPDRLEKQYQYLLNNPHVDLVGLNVLMVDEKGQDIHVETYPKSFDAVKEILPLASPVPHFWLSKRIVYEVVGDYRIPPVEDYDFIFRAVENGFIINNVPHILYHQRVRLGNTATATGLVQRKTIEYVQSLAIERRFRKDNTDSFSLSNLRRFIDSGYFEREFFKISSAFHFRYFTTKQKSKILAVVYMFLAVLFSPKIKLKEIRNRYYIKKIKQKYMDVHGS